MRKCIIHAGTHKTGTSSIQSALTLYSKEIAESGFNYPIAGRQGGHHSIAFSMFDPSRVASYGGMGVSDLINEIRNTSLDIILSSEEFVHAIHYASDSFQAFVNLLANYFTNIEIVVYLRNQPDFLHSNYFGRLRSGMSADYLEYMFQRLNRNLSEFPLDYRLLVDELLSIRNATVIVKDYNQVDAVKDFFDVCGIEGAENIKFDKINALPDLHTSFVRYFENVLRRKMRQQEREVIDNNLSLFQDNDFKMSHICRYAIISRFSASNMDVSNKFNLRGLEVGCYKNIECYDNRVFSSEPDLRNPILSVGNELCIDAIFSRSFVESVCRFVSD